MKKTLSVFVAAILTVTLLGGFAVNPGAPYAPVAPTAAETEIGLETDNMPLQSVDWIKFDIPVYALQDYLEVGSYFIVSLPANLGAEEVQWNVLDEGLLYRLPTVAKDDGTYDARVTFCSLDIDASGMRGHDYDGYDTAIPLGPQLAEVSLTAYPSSSVNSEELSQLLFNYGSKSSVTFYRPDGSPIVGSTSYLSSWETTQDSFKPSLGFTTGNDDNSFSWKVTPSSVITLENAEFATLTVTLSEPVCGMAEYTLYCGDKFDSLPFSVKWYDYDDTRTFVSRATVNGAVSELRFVVPVNVLLECRGFAIFENIMLYDTSVMANYMTVDRSKVGEGAGSSGNISWTADSDRAYYMGMPINYSFTDAAKPYGATAGAQSLKLSASMHNTVYKSDRLVHWQECEADGFMTKVELHTFENGVCTVCHAKQNRLGDLNGDGNVTVSDGVTMQRILAGLES